MPSNIPLLAPKQPNESDPIPFDIDSYVNSAYKDISMEDVPSKVGAFTEALQHIARPFFATGYNSIATLNRGTAAFYSHLDSIADYIEASSGFKSGNLFEDLATVASNDAERWAQAADDVGVTFLDEMISEAVGGFVPGVTQFAIDVGSGYTFPYMAGAYEASEKDENPFAAGMVAAAKTATLDKLFRMMSPLKTYLKAPAFGTVFGIEEAAFAEDGKKARAFAKGAGIGAMYAMSSPGGVLGLNDVKAATKLAIDNLKTTPAGEFAARKLAEERGSIEVEPKKRQRKFLKTIEEAREIDPTAREKIKEIEPQDYFIEPNIQSLEKAQKRIETEGISKTTKYLESDIPPGAEKGATFHLMIKDAQKRGDYDRQIELIELADKQLREAGRFIQSASLWNKMGSSTGFIKWANRKLESVRDKYTWADTIIKHKPKSFELDKEEQKIIIDTFRDMKKMESEIDRQDATLKLVDMVAKKVPPSVSEWVDAYRYQNMLSSPKTQMRNIGENIGNTFLSRPIDITTKGAIDFVKAGVFGKAREAYVKDVPTYYKAAWNAIPNAANAFSESMKLSRGSTVGKPDVGIEAKTEFERSRAKQLPTALTLVGRFMEASDKFNSAVIGAGEMAIQMKKGVPEAEAYEKGHLLAEQYLYRERLEQGDKSMSGFSQVLNSVGNLIEKSRTLPKIGTLSKWFVPFLRTPINKAIQMVEHSPLGLARAPSRFTPESSAKILAGSIVTAVGATAAYMGETTWAPPTSRDEKELFYATGRKPYSAQLGNTWVPMWYLGPYALAFAIPTAVKYYTEDESKAITKDGYDKLLDIAQGTAQFIGSQSSTQSIGALFSALHGDIDYTFSSQTGFTVQQIIPAGSLVRYVNTIIDPVYRKPKGFIEGIEANLPVLSQNLEAHMTPILEEAKRDPRNYFLPYDIGAAQKQYEPEYNETRFIQREKRLIKQQRKITKDLIEGKITVEESHKLLYENNKKSLKNLPKPRR